jgi:hypothetical protein
MMLFLAIIFSMTMLLSIAWVMGIDENKDIKDVDWP